MESYCSTMDKVGERLSSIVTAFPCVFTAFQCLKTMRRSQQLYSHHVKSYTAELVSPSGTRHQHTNLGAL